MAETRRTYRTGNDEQPQQERSAPPRKDYNRGGNNKGGKDNSAFKTITGLFRSKNGKSDTVFLTEEMCDIFQQLRPGDLIGVSENKKTNRLHLWYIPKED